MTTSEAAGTDEVSRRMVEQVGERQDELAVAVAELSSVLLADEGLEATLHRVAQLACRTMPGCDAAGVTLVAASGEPETAACTDDVVLQVDLRQYGIGDGPCLDALRHVRINSVDAAQARERWPVFAAEAAELGLHSFLAAPLVAGGASLGGLNLYSRSHDGFHHLDENLVTMFSAQASVALANSRLYRSAVQLADQLQEAMASRALIEQAKGILMAQERVDADTAFMLLRERSQRSNRKLRDVSADVVASLA